MNINNIEILDFHSTLETLTPELAAFLIREHKYHLQRRLDPTNVEMMDRAMGRGEFPITTLWLCKSLDTGKEDLIDGFHRLTSSMERGHSFRAMLQRIVVHTEQDKKALWMFLDGGGKQRTAMDYRPMLQGQMEGLASYRRGALERGSGAIAYRFSERYFRAFRSLKVPTGERIQIIEQYLPFAHDYFTAIRRGAVMAKGLGTGFVVALGVVLIESQKGIAVPFFESIAANDGMKEGDPRWLFLKSLNTNGALTRDTFRTMQRLGLCWNSHYKREERRHFRDLGEGVIVPLKGTEYQIGG